MIPYDFIRLEEGFPVYRRVDIDMYGMPDLYGVYEYLVVSTEEDIAPREMDWKMIQDR
jgi:hypothetical protein